MVERYGYMVHYRVFQKIENKAVPTDIVQQSVTYIDKPQHIRYQKD